MIYFSPADRAVPLRGRLAIRAVLKRLFLTEGRFLISLQYVFCSDEYLLQINREFLGHDYYTDIVTFELSPDPKFGIEGEIYISIDRVRENAMTLGTPTRPELLRVLFHGALHLCGYKDKTKEEKKVMRHKEEEYMALCN
jgi:probable rRNA maturation factor